MTVSPDPKALVDRLRQLPADARRRGKDLLLALPVQVPGLDPTEVELEVPPEARYHVLPHGAGWSLRRGDAQAPERLFSAREAALGVARERARADQAVVVVHDKRGRIASIEPAEPDPSSPVGQA